MSSLRFLVGFLGGALRALPKAKAATQDGGVSLARQFSELIRLRAGPGKLNPDDYYRMRVYRKDLSFAEKAKYISNTAFGAIKRDRRWGVVADDKLLTYGLLMGYGIRIPEIHALIHPVRAFGNLRTLRSGPELKEYLLNGAPYPFFSKPVQGIYSQDTLLVKALDPTKQALMLGDGSEVSLEEYVRDCSERTSGHLIQELLHPHPEIAEVCGDHLCTVRAIVMLDRDGPRIFCTLWKIAASENMADNYWRKGNMLAVLDRSDGSVIRCTTGLGPDMREVDRHPATGKPLIGFKLPDWDEAIDLVLSAARAIPGLPIQAWDIALTSKGPMALEVNVFGSVFLPQIAMQQGLLEGELAAFMEKNRH